MGRQVLRIFRNANFDAVIHFAAVAYVGESVAEPLRYYDNITSNTVTLLKTMTATGVNRLIYSRCARGFFSHVTTRHHTSPGPPTRLRHTGRPATSRRPGGPCSHRVGLRSFGWYIYTLGGTISQSDR